MNKSLIGSNVINSWSFNIFDTYPSLPYRLLNYALLNPPRLRFFKFECFKMCYHIQLSCLPKIRYSHQSAKNDLLCTSQGFVKYVRFKGFSPPQEYLDLLSSQLPNIECITCTYHGYIERFDDARAPISFAFNLTAFKKLEAFHMNIDTVVNAKISLITCFSLCV